MRRLNPKAMRRISRRPKMGKLILILTTTGRKSGLPRSTPLQYEEHGDMYYIGAARGMAADWLRNLQAEPNAQVQIADKSIAVRGEVIFDVQDIVAYLQMRLKRRPVMMRAMLLMHGLPPWAKARQLRKLAEGLAVVQLIPLEQSK